MMTAANFATILSQLDAVGWVQLKGHFDRISKDALLRFAEAFGQSTPTRRGGPTIDTLRPTLPEHAHESSLSKQHGYDAFPFHTDTAHWHRPAKYIVLACIDPGVQKAETLLLPLASMRLSTHALNDLTTGVFLVTNGRNSFYTGARSQDGNVLRFDPGCMSPQTLSAKRGWETIHSRIRASAPYVVDWDRGDVLIINNWMVLHGRSAISNAIGRELLRVTLSERPGDAY